MGGLSIKNWEAFTFNSPMDDKQMVENIETFLFKNKISAKDISFVLECNNILFRNIEIPIIDKRYMKQNIELEMKKYINEGYEKYYMDYQIIREKRDREKKCYYIIVALMPKEIVNKYVSISKKLNMSLLKIDIWPNSFSKVYKMFSGKSKLHSCTAVMTIGEEESSISILDNGNLAIHKYIEYGIKDIIKETPSYKDIYDNQTVGLIDEYSIKREDLKLFDKILKFFMNVLRLYIESKDEINIDTIYTSITSINSLPLNKYISDYFSVPVYPISILTDKKNKIFNNKCEDIDNYLNLIGMLI